MSRYGLSRVIVYTLGMAWAVLATAGGANAAATDLIFLTADSAPVQTVSVEDLQNIYLGKKRVVAGFPVFAVDQSETEPVKLDFLKNVLHMTHAEYRTQLLKRIFQEGAVGPRFVANSTEALKAIRETKGAIGYVYQADVGSLFGLRVLATVPTK